MRRKTEYGLYIIFALASLLSLLLCICSDLSSRAGSNLRAVRVEGEYSIDGGGYMPLLPDTQFDVSDYHTISIRGHFTQEIPEHMQLLLRLSNVNADLMVNGRLIFSNTREAGSFSRSPGNGWTAISSPGITTADTVELCLSNVYKKGNPKTFSHAVDEMRIGYEGDLTRLILRESTGSVMFGFLTIPLGALLFLMGLVVSQINRERIFSLALFCFSVGVWILADPNFMAFLVDSPDFISAASQIAQFLQLISITRFVHSIVCGRIRTGVGIIHWCTVLLFGTASVCQLLRLWDYYDFTFSFMVLNSIVCVSMLSALSAETIKKNEYAAKTLLSVLPLGVFSLIEQAAWSMGYYYKGIPTQFGFLIFLGIQAVYTVREAKVMIYHLERAQRMENDLIQSRISIMLGQIQPHFLFNSLVCIRQLCKAEPQKAVEALDHFSCFLRGNVDSLSDNGLIPFSRELLHVRDYLYLEKMRFGARLNICEEIEENAFMLPPLTLQPIVENAVRHGIMKKKGNGTLTIRSERQPGAVLVKIIDDGAGFDVDRTEDRGRSHVGIINVRKRLEMQCGGSLLINSVKGSGTEATIILPQERRQDENYGGR